MSFLWLLVIIVAALFDGLLLIWLQRRWRQGSASEPPASGRVLVFGSYSPIVTWLVGRLPAGQQHRFATIGTRIQWPRWAGRAVSAIGSFIRVAQERMAQGLTRPLPGFNAGSWLERLQPGPVLLAGGLAVTAASALVQSQLSDAASWPGNVVLLLGLLVAAAGVAALRVSGFRRGLLGLGQRLGVGPGQVACLIVSVPLTLLSGVLSAFDNAHSTNPVMANLAWASALVLVVAGGWPVRPAQADRPRWSLAVLLAGLVALGVALRAVDLTYIPVTLTGDEGSSALNAAAFISGQMNNLFGSGWHGFPGLYFWLQAVPILALGRTIAAARLSAVLAGSLTVGAVYLLGRSLYGHRVGLVAALFLAGFNIHLHFSRIGLNNVWDGLSCVVILGALWHGWKTGQRVSFLLAGLGLGLAQYFYPSSRVLLLLVPLWLLIAAALDRRRFWRLVPHLLLMGLVAAVTLLPVAWFYDLHPDEFFGPLRAVSILGPNFANFVRASGQPAWLFLTHQIGLGLGAYVTTPLKYWYQPGTPMLRPVPALFFLLAVAVLAWRVRDPRSWLLILWLLAFGLVGGLSESTPAAQRYVGVTPGVALLVGLGLVWVSDQLSQQWPGLARGSAALLLLTALTITIDDARFYLVEYTAASHFGGSHDFEGLGAAVAGRLATYVHDLSPDWQVVFFGTPVMGYASIPSLQFLAPQINGLDMNQPWGSPDNPAITSQHLIFAFLPGHAADLAGVQAQYPQGFLVSTAGLFGNPIVDIYQYPYPADAAERLARMQARPPAFPIQFSSLDLWMLYALLVLVGAAWVLWQARSQLALGQGLGAGGRHFQPSIVPLDYSDRPVSRDSATPPTDLIPIEPGTAAALVAPSSEPAAQPVVSQPAGGPPAAEPPGRVPPAPLPAVASLQVSLNLRPGAHLRIRIEELSQDGEQPVTLVSQDVRAPQSPDHLDGQQPATVLVTFGEAAPSADPSLLLPRETAPARGAPPPARQQLAGAPAASLPSLSASPPASAPLAQLSNRWSQWAGALKPPFQGIAWPAPWAQRARGVAAGLQARLRAEPLAVTLFAVALVLYLITRLVGIDRYPIYFFTDEAAHMVSASSFVQNGLRNGDNEFMPTYFSLGSSYNLNSVSVYLQVLPYLIFGKSEAVTRGTSALVTVLAAIAVGLIMRDIFKARYWWVATLLLSTAPAWFLHSRTAFENVEVASFYAVFLYFYLRYRRDTPNFLYPAIVFGALTFYTHSLGVPLMALTGVLLLISDWPYHWRQRAVVGRGLILVAVLALPYLRYGLAHPASFMSALRQRDSYWTDISLSLSAKLQMFAKEYAYGLSPAYWFQPANGRDLERHVMLGYGNLWWPTLPLAALGLGLALRRVATSAYRTILLAMLAAPAGSALVAIGIPRVLWFIIPAVLLMALGLNAILEWLEARRAPLVALSLATFVVLGGFNVYLFADALRNGPLWPRDYSLYGVQYGARQLFGETIPALLAADPNRQVVVSPNWANGTNLLEQFFMTPQQQARVQLQGADYYLTQKRDLPADLTVVLIPDEYAHFIADPKVDHVQVQQVLPYPNGQPGFYFLTFSYSAQADALFEAEHEALVKPITETIAFAGQTITVTHPHFGAGQLQNIFDGDPFTLVNAPGFNPMVLDFAFPAPRPMSGLTLTTGAMADFTVTATVYANTTALPQVYSQEFVGLPPDPTVKFDFNQGPGSAVRLLLEIENNADHTPNVNIHVREVQFR